MKSKSHTIMASIEKNYQARQALNFTIAFGLTSKLIADNLPRDSKNHPRWRRAQNPHQILKESPQIWLARDNLQNQDILPLTPFGL